MISENCERLATPLRLQHSAAGPRERAYHRYESIQFRDFLESLAAARFKPKSFKHPTPHAVPAPLKKGEHSDTLPMVDVFGISRKTTELTSSASRSRALPIR